MRRLLAAATAAAAVAVLAATAAATIVLRVTPRELADTANLVVEGRVAAVDVRWDSARTCINTYSTFSVERTHKGPAAASVVVKVPGGRVGDDEVRVEGTAKFSVGEEALLFLWRDAQGEWLVLGEAQGKFRLTRDGTTGERIAENSLKGLCLVVRGDPKGSGASAGRRADRLPLEDLVAVVKASVEAQKPAPGTKPPGTGTPPAGRDPAPPDATPDPPSTTTTPDDEAPPPTKDVPAPQTGGSDPVKDAPQPAPDKR